MAGALLALLLFGKTMSIVSMIGIIMLMGLVAKNAILMVDFTNTLRNRGKSRTEAILTAGPIRLKPIMMTTMAMIGGMLPTAMAVTRGAEIRQPLAICVIGGLTLSLLLTLIVIPVVYTIVDDLWHWILGKLAPNAERRSQEKQREIVEAYQESIKHKGENWSED
jgi:HAE1 family hydrophobic/amphiphilic exporter-1